MLPISIDFRDEVDELHAFLETLGEDDWNRPTGFKAWTPWDVVAHLHFFDCVSRKSLEGEEAFASEREALMKNIAEGRAHREAHRERFGHLDARALLAEWRDTAHALATALGESDPKRRLPWFGPDMGVTMFTTARYMETWAHGLAIYDLTGVERKESDRIQNVATIGVRTFGWTFVNRKRALPGDPPYVELEAPSGERWSFNEPSEADFVKGSAVDFCRVVTQTRNVADTSLTVVGPVSTAWMEIAQCFAGAPEDPPAPGTRGPAR